MAPLSPRRRTVSSRRSNDSLKTSLPISSELDNSFPAAKSESKTSESESENPKSSTQKNAESDAAKKWRDLALRSKSAIFMLGVFFFCIYMGHVYTGFLVLFLQGMMFKEVMALFYHKYVDKETNMKLFRSWQWYFLTVLLFFLYGGFLADYMGELPLAQNYLMRYHNLVCYLLYTLGIVGFVICLEKSLYRVQLQQFAWTHMCLLLVVVQSTALLRNIFEGMIWFLLPTTLIIINDITAYVWGRLLGRTKLIRVSPKKTWEGFIGAFFSTLIFAYWFSGFLSQFQAMICPKTDFLSRLVCEPGWVFTVQTYSVPEWIQNLLFSVGVQISSWTCLPIQLHALSFATFGSLIAPFGGFFASFVKRALDIKDFGDTIPGHGGFTDRFDCQMIMGFFSFLYFKTFLKYPSQVDYFIDRIGRLDRHSQLQLFQHLQKLLS